MPRCVCHHYVVSLLVGFHLAFSRRLCVYISCRRYHLFFRIAVDHETQRRHHHQLQAFWEVISHFTLGGACEPVFCVLYVCVWNWNYGGLKSCRIKIRVWIL